MLTPIALGGGFDTHYDRLHKNLRQLASNARQAGDKASIEHALELLAEARLRIEKELSDERIAQGELQKQQAADTAPENAEAYRRARQINEHNQLRLKDLIQYVRQEHASISARLKTFKPESMDDPSFRLMPAPDH